MSLERIHLFVLSLLIRTAGVLFLVEAAQALDRTLNYAVYPPPVSVGAAHLFYTFIYAFGFAVKAGIAIYFLLGAPPALSWVQRFPPLPPSPGETKPENKLD